MKYVILIPLLWASIANARWLKKAEAGNVVEKYEIAFDVKKNGSYTQVVEYATRVQSEDAKTGASLFTIEYNSATEKIEILEAFTRNGKTDVKVEPSQIEDRDKGESKDYDATKIRSVVFPQVQIGSRLFIRYRMTNEKPFMEGRWSDYLSLYPSIWVEKFKLDVKSERPLFYSVADVRELIKVKRHDKNHLTVTNRRELPGWVSAEKDPYFHPDGHTQVWISTEREWGPFMADLNKQYEGVQAAGLPPKLKAWVAEAGKRKTPEDQVLYLMERMSKEFRYFGDWRRHNGGLIPRTLVEIESSRYGDCKDLSSLLTSMLRALKLPANVALIRRGDNPYGRENEYEIPASSRFNHAITQVKLGERTFWLDATNPVASLRAYPDISGRPAYVLVRTGAYFDRLPEAQPVDFTHVHDYEYRFKPDEIVGVKVNAQLKNLAPFQLANELMMRPKSEVITNTLDYFSEGQEVRSFKYEREPQTGRVLEDMKIALDYEAGRVTYNAGKGAFFVIPDGFLQGAFFETEARESDMRLAEEPYAFVGTRRLKDTRLAQDVPAPCRIESPWMSLDRQVKLDGRDVVITQRIELKKAYIKRDEFRSAPFRKLQSEAKRCFYRSGVLIEPAAKGALSSNSH